MTMRLSRWRATWTLVVSGTVRRCRHVVHGTPVGRSPNPLTGRVHYSTVDLHGLELVDISQTAPTHTDGNGALR